MNSNKKKKGKEEVVMISLEENQKRKVNNNDESGSDSEMIDLKRMKNNNDDEPRIFMCNICHHEDASKPLFMKSEVRLDLNEKEQEVLMFRFNTPVKVICLSHYEKEVRFWFNKNTKQCSNLFGTHKKSKKSKVWTKEIDLVTAKEAKKYTSHDISPSQRLCRICFEKLQGEIKSGKEVEEAINEDFATANDDNDVNDDPADEEWSETPAESVTTSEDAENDDLNEIINNIRDKGPECNKLQKIALIQILPKKWSIKKIGDLTGLSRRLGNSLQ